MAVTVTNIEIVSTNSSGQNANGSSSLPNFSPDGTKITFASGATNLVPDDHNGKTDIFVKDLVSGAVTRVSTGNADIEGDGNSSNPFFSPDGTKIAFTSLSKNFAAGDTNNHQDIFVKDLSTGDLIFVSADINGVSPYGTSAHPSWSADSKLVAFDSTADSLIPGGSPEDVSLEGPNLFYKNIETGEVTLITPYPVIGWSNAPVFSPDGTKVAFEHGWNRDVIPEDVNNRVDVFLKDLITGTYSFVSVDKDGNQSNENSRSEGLSFSPDGTQVAFLSGASNFVENDTNNIYEPDIFLKNILTGEILAVSADASGNIGNGPSANPVFSPDRKHIAFVSEASNLVPDDNNNSRDLFIKNIETGEITRILENVTSPVVSFSPDGTKLAATLGGSIVVLTLDVPETHVGTEGHDRISGGNDDDIIYGDGGDDVLKGQKGDDFLCGGAGDDTLWGNNGNDLLKGGEGSDWMKGGNGNDTFILDVLDGHVDTIADLRTHDKIDLYDLFQDAYGFTKDGAFSDGFIRLEQDGKDVDLYVDIDGADGPNSEVLLAMLLKVDASDFGPDNFIVPEKGLDVDFRLEGDNGSNTLIGSYGDNTLVGRAGDDVLIGKEGNDTLWGNSGNDTLYGGHGIDWMKGGDGADLFILDGNDPGFNTIHDLRLHKGDRIQINDILDFDPHTDDIADFIQITQSGTNSIISVDLDGSANGESFQHIAQTTGIVGLDVEQMYADGDLIIQNAIV